MHAGQRYFLTGAEAVGYADLARALSDVIGEAVTYHAISMDAMRKRLESRGVADALIDALLAIAAYQKAGGPTERVSDSVQQILGRSPRSIRDFVRDYASAFVGDQR